MGRFHRGRYYFDFLNLVEELRQEDDACFICGSKKNVNPHHIVKFKDNDKRYADKNNVVLLCGYHHHSYHKHYGSGKGVNQKTFAIFCKKEFQKEINKNRLRRCDEE